MAASIRAVDDSTATGGSNINTGFRVSSLAASVSSPGETPFRCGHWRLADGHPL